MIMILLYLVIFFPAKIFNLLNSNHIQLTSYRKCNNKKWMILVLGLFQEVMISNNHIKSEKSLPFQWNNLHSRCCKKLLSRSLNIIDVKYLQINECNSKSESFSKRFSGQKLNYNKLRDDSITCALTSFLKAGVSDYNMEQSFLSTPRNFHVMMENGTIVIEKTKNIEAINKIESYAKEFGWNDLIIKEKMSWKDTNTTQEDIIKGKSKLKYLNEFKNRIIKLRYAANDDISYKDPIRKPFIGILTPKLGPYCQLMEKDHSRIEIFLKKVRENYSPEKLQFVSMKLDYKLPLCEIFFVGPIPEQMRVFYARGGTLQADVRPRFWTICEILEKDERLFQKYGGAGCPGLFPKWDMQGMLEEIDECMNQPPIYATNFDLNFDWQNPGAYVPENFKDRAWWYNNVHLPTRRMVQVAFENGVEDYRSVIQTEYEYLCKKDANPNYPLMESA